MKRLFVWVHGPEGTINELVRQSLHQPLASALDIHERGAAVPRDFGGGELREVGGLGDAEVLDHPVEQVGELGVGEGGLGGAWDLDEKTAAVGGECKGGEGVLDRRHPARLAGAVGGVASHALEHVVDTRLVGPGRVTTTHRGCKQDEPKRAAC
jgi:hypothetical protein